MAWFAAHAVMYLKLKDEPQDNFLVWENVLLVQADTPDQAEERAVARAREDEGDSNGTLTYGDKPATWVFAGLRKVLSVAHRADSLRSGDEVTYSEFLLQDLASIQKFARGDDLEVRYVE